MTFTARSAAAIRDAALENLRARYLARGEDIDTSEGSDAYNQLDALALEFEGLELAAQEAAHRILLRYQTGTDLDESAEDDGTARKAATFARRDVSVSGPGSTTTAVAGATLSTASGLRFRPINPATGATLTSIETDGDGVVAIAVECLTAGVAGNLAVNVTLTWSSAPTGFAATGAVVASAPSNARAGEDRESDDDLRNRLLLRRKERPGGGNRSWWWAEARKCAGVGEAFVYRVMTAPETAPGSGVYNYTPNTRGATTVIPIAPGPSSYAEGGDGRSATFSRIPSDALVELVSGYFDGTVDADGVAVTAYGAELYPAHMQANFYVVPPRAYGRNVVYSVQAASGWRWLPGSNAVDVSGSSTATVLELDLPVTGWEAGDRIAIADWGTGATRTRGGWFLRRIQSVNTGSRSVTLTEALPGAPPAGTATRPDAVNSAGASLWLNLLVETARMFDAMGPGAGPAQTFRFPDPVRDNIACDLTRASLLRVALNAPGVADAAITAPAASEAAPVGGLFELGSLRIERMV